MSSSVVSHPILNCDGCSVIYGPVAGVRGALELRAQAYAQGWRYPPKVDSRGKPTVARHSDVCPACIEGWTPVVYRSKRA